MKPVKQLLNCCVLLLLIVSCKKEVESSQQLQPTPLTKDQVYKQWDNTVKSVAMDISNKLKSLEFRKMLRHEVLLRFDGDANILISSMMKRLPKYLEYERIHHSLNRTEDENELLASFNFDILQNAAVNFPQMQIAVQTDADIWDANTFIPKVVYMTADFDESTHSTIEGFDGNQQVISVSTLIDPVDNYVVISQNERTILRPNDALRIRNTECLVDDLVGNAPYNPEGNIIPLEPCVGSGGPGGGTGGGTGGSTSYSQYLGIGQDGVLPTLIGIQAGTITSSPTNGTFSKLDPIGTFNGTTVYRKNYKHEKMRFIRCDNINQIERWPAGAPEIRMHVFEQNVLNPSENLQIYKEEFEPPRRKDIKDKWWDCSGIAMHLWDYSGTGTKASFAYYEYDPVLIPNEALQNIGALYVDLLTITGIIPVANTTQVAIYGNIRQTVQSAIRSLKKKNGMSEYIGKDDYSIFNDEDQFNHSPGGTKFKTWPDL